QYEPVNNDNARAGAVMALGQPVNTIYDFSKADRVLSLDADFLSAHPGSLKYARDFAARRRPREGSDPHIIDIPVDRSKMMCRLYVIETTPTTTGASADHHWSVKPSELFQVTKTLAVSLSLLKASLPKFVEGLGPKWVDGLAKDLQEHQGASIIIAGKEAPPEVHALAHAMND